MKVSRMLIAILTAAILLLPAANGAAELTSLTVTHVRQEEGMVYAYFDAIDAEGLPVNGLKAETVQATIDGEKVEMVSLDAISATDEGVAYIFLMGTASSLKSQRNVTQLKSSVESWISGMRSYDVAALMSYGRSVNTHMEFTNNKNDLIAASNSLTYQWSNAVYLFNGIEAAVKLFEQNDDRSARRILVLLTEGRDTGSDRNVIDRLLTQVNNTDIILYVIGFVRDDSDEVLFSDIARAAVRTGGTMVRCSDAAEIRDAYASLMRRIQGSYVATLNVTGMEMNPAGVTVGLLAKQDTKSASGAKNAVLDLIAVTPTPAVSKIEVETGEISSPLPTDGPPIEKMFLSLLPFILGGIALLAIVAICILLVIRTKNAKYKEKELADGQLSPEDFLLQDDAYEKTIAASSAYEQTVGADDTISILGKDSYMVAFQITEPKGVAWQKRLSVSKEFIIGRDPSANLQIQEASVSRRHAKMEYTGKKLTIQDLGSSNGLFVNGIKTVTPQLLKSGDKLKVGNVSVQIKF